MPAPAGKCCAPTAPTCAPTVKPLFKQNVETKPTEMQLSSVGKMGGELLRKYKSSAL